MHRILIVDDHLIVQIGLELIISKYLTAELEYAIDGKDTLKKIKEKLYDLLLLDINMPNTDCGKLISTIRSFIPDQKILLFSMNEEAFFAKYYLKLGVRGFLSKRSPETEIIHAIKEVLNGKTYTSPEFIEPPDHDVKYMRSNKNPFDLLSEREVTIAVYLLKGKNTQEISEMMDLNTSTIGTHKANIFKKLGINNVVSLMEMAKLYNIM